MTQKQTLLSILFLLLLLLVCAGCTTVIDVKVDRPAELDIKDAKTLIILPFKTSAEMEESRIEKTYAAEYFRKLDVITSSAETKTEEEYIIAILNEELENKLKTSTNLELISVEYARETTGKMNPIPADIVLSGGIRYYGTEVHSEERTLVQKDKKTEKILWYWRTITLSIEYTIYDTKTNTALESRERKYSLTSDETQTLAFVPTAEKMAVKGMRYFAESVYKQFEPYVEKKVLSLLYHKDTSMKDANDYAQSGDLTTALSKYRALYQNYGYFEAGYNIGIILQVTGNYDEAENIMLELCEKFRDKRALEALRDIENDKFSANKLKTQRADTSD